ncbi:MAG: helix-turn-helix transcriptional regulator [Clostridia bacterium]|nr:helix-turn-helix transcriptional regulator [Clostridia bacterium]
MKETKQIIASNLTALRLERKLTQAELAEKLNYSDKTVSKWEHGETTPPIDVLKQLAELYEVSVDYIINENYEDNYDKIYNNKQNRYNKLAITLLAVSLIWLIATVLYIYGILLNNTNNWFLFVCSVPFSLVVLLIFNSIWGKRRYNYLIISLLVWTCLLSIYFYFFAYNPWAIFIIGVPGQIAIILWSQLKVNKKR